MALFGWLTGSSEGRTHQLERPPVASEDIVFVAIDVETANGDRSSICQIGVAFMMPEGVVQYGSLVDPKVSVDPFNFSIHGISTRDLRGAPSFREVIKTLRPFLEGQIVVGHSSFDKSAFNAACELNGVPNLQVDWRDSIIAAKNAWPGRKSYKLSNLAKFLEIQLDHHDAVSDATAAAFIVTKAAMSTGRSIDDVLTIAPKPNRQRQRQRPAPEPSAALYGQCVCFTGQITIARHDAQKLAALAGLEVKSGVSKKVNYLVVGDQDLDKLAGHEKSSKHRKAEELQLGGHDIQIIGETAFLKLVSDR